MNYQAMKSNSQEPAIAIVPYGSWPTFGLRKMPLDSLEWPIGRPERLMQGTVSSLKEKDHLITFPRKPVFFLPPYKVKANISLMIVEPDNVHKLYISLTKYLNWRFYKILTKNKNLIKTKHNCTFFYFGSTILENYQRITFQKIKMASLIASTQNQLIGHKLRHEVASHIKSRHLDVQVIGAGYKPFKNKEDGLKSYRYSIVIENSAEQDYFSEKVIDACLLETIPIYWGAPNISEYFDLRGFVICKDLNDILNAIQKMSINDYNSKLVWIKKNKDNALFHSEYKKRAAQIIKKSIKN